MKLLILFKKKIATNIAEMMADYDKALPASIIDCRAATANAVTFHAQQTANGYTLIIYRI